MTESSFKVQLNVYDLSGGMAAQWSRQLCGRQIDGIWHTGIVIYGKEFYYGGGISYDLPGSTPFGTYTILV
jgi:desumoylating isopeptidase 1